MQNPMTIRWIVFFLYVSTALPSNIAAAQEPGGARITGFVLDEGTGNPLGGARLELRGPSLVNGREAFTAGDGAFALSDVPPGQYRIRAEHAGYLPQGYSPQTSQTPDSQIDIAAGETYNLTFRLRRGAKIAGRVYDTNRLPVADAQIHILSHRFGGFGQRILIPVPDIDSVATNSDGEYTVQGLPAGKYFVRATTTAPTDSRGVVTQGMAPTYYPGVTNPDHAVAIDVLASSEMPAVDFAIDATLRFNVSGRIVNPLAQGEGSVYRYYLVPRDATTTEPPAPLTNYAASGSAFELRAIPPGAYTLYIGYEQPRVPPLRDFTLYAGRASFDIVDQDIAELTVAIEPGVDLAGQLVLDESARNIVGSIERNYPLLTQIDGLPGIFSPTAILSRSRFVESDGTFKIPHAIHASYILTMVLENTPGLYLAAARLGTQDVLALPFEIDAGTTGPLILELSGAGATFQGNVVDLRGMPISEAHVVLIPPVNFRGDQTAYKTAITDARGSFAIAGLRPGEYTALAFERRIEPRSWLNPEFMIPYLNSGTPIDLTRYQVLQRELRTIRLVR